jgi:WD40 repeat protein
VYRVAFAADGRTLASAGADGHAVLWDLSDEDRPRALGPPLTAHAGAANGVQFVAGTSRLATTGIDGMLRLWNLGELNAARDRPAAAACAITGRGLDEGEWAGYIPGLGYENTCPG